MADAVEQEDSDVIEITSAEDYAPQKAKLKASISWILSKAYGTNIPVQAKDPFYENAKGQLQVRPQLVNLMTSSELYCQACSNMFSETAFHWQGHWNVIQVLSRKGLPVTEVGGTVVTETVLMHTAPFRVAAHLALIDTLMKAYASEIASLEKVLQSVRRHSRVPDPLPSSVDEGLVLWINKTCSALADREHAHLGQGPARRKLERMSKTKPGDPGNAHPRIADLMNDLRDGCCVAATISFYQPDSVPLTDVCLKDAMAIADSLYNLRLIQSFCNNSLAFKCFHFTYEDLLYGKQDLRDNVLVFLAELFFLLERMQPKTDPKNIPVEGSSRVSVRRPPSPTGRQSIHVAKRGCLRNAGEATVMGTSPRTKESSGLLQNVSRSLDADVTDSTDLGPVTSAGLARSETAGTPSLVKASGVRQEQLLPAQLHMSKEKGQQDSKAEELGDQSHKQRMAAESRLMRGKVSMPRSGGHRKVDSAEAEAGPEHLSLALGDNSMTALSGGVSIVSRSSDDSGRSVISQQQHRVPGTQPYAIPENKPRESILPSSRTVDGVAGHGHTPASDLCTDSDYAARHMRTSREGSIASSRSSGDFSDHESLKIHQDHKARESLKLSPQQTMEPHRSQTHATPRGPSHSLPEESARPGQHIRSLSARGEERLTDVSQSQVIVREGGEETLRNAALQQHQLREANGEGSSPENRASLRSAFLQRSDSGAKKTSFAQLPTETTWQERAQRSVSQAAPVMTRSDSSVSDGERPPLSELSQLRLKLEEKRREIERKKQQQEVQSAKMRQRLGKAAFMRVISKKDESGNTVGVSSRRVLPAWVGAGRADDVTKSSFNQTLLQDRLGKLGSEEPSRPTTLMTSSPSSSNSTSASQSPSTAGRPFSREGIQQTIDSVRRRWFHGSDPEGEMIYSTDETDGAEGIAVSELSFDMMQSCPPSMGAAMFGYSASGSEVDTVEEDQGLSESGASSYPPHRELSQSPRRTPEKRVSWAESRNQKDYDESLNKLNRSLTDLQGEIKRLSLQQQDVFPPSEACEEQPQESGVSVAQAPHEPALSSAGSHFPQRQVQHSSPFHAVSHQPLPSQVPQTTDSLPLSSSSQSHPHIPGLPHAGRHSNSVDQDSSADGFFVSFGEDTPRRPKPQLSIARDSGGKKDLVSDSGREGTDGVSRLQGKTSAAVVADSDSGSSSSGSYHSLPGGSEESSVEVSRAAQQITVPESEMERKRQRLLQQQQKRQGELEKKRLEKEMEAQRRQQARVMKEEEVEKKKAEEKARREAIFQQYIQKKLEQDDDKSSSPSTVNRRDRSVPSGSRRDHSVSRRNHSRHRQPRPKSMFAKAKPLHSDLEDSRGLSSHSSQEDLSSHSSPMGSTVSCDGLNQNEDQGPATTRRPPSPGTKLYVKPSAKSNRHIIINALSYCCLAGIVNTDQKNKVLEEIAKSSSKHFLILFRDHGCQYRGLFSFDPDTEEACKIMGVGPRQLSSDMVERFYKYNSGAKSFTEVTSTKHLSVSIDAVVLKNAYWKSKVISAAKR